MTILDVQPPMPGNEWHEEDRRWSPVPISLIHPTPSLLLTGTLMMGRKEDGHPKAWMNRCADVSDRIPKTESSFLQHTRIGKWPESADKQVLYYETKG